MAKLDLDDFFTDSINSTASKLPLLRGGKDSGHYLMILGFDAKSVAKARFDRGRAYTKATEAIKDFDHEEKEFELSRIVDEISKPLACDLIESWSFSKKPTDKNKRRLLDENSGLASIICAHSATEENYFLKK